MGEKRNLPRRRLLHWSALAAASVLGGCGPGTLVPRGTVPASTPRATQARLTLTYGRPSGEYYSGTEYDMAGTLVALLQGAGLLGELEVEDLAVPGEYAAGLAALQASGTGPDVHIQFAELVPDCTRAGLLLPLDPVLAVDGSLDLEDFYSSQVEPARHDGQLWALPWCSSGAFLLVNRDLFGTCSAELPSSGWRWDDFRSCAVQLSDPARRRWGAGAVDTPWQIAERIWQNGAAIFDPERTSCLLAEPLAVEAMAYWVDLTLKDRALPDPRADQAAGGSGALFRAGQVAMCEDSLWAIAGYRQMAFAWDLAPLPHQRQKTGWLWSSYQAIGAHTRHPTEAWGLLKAILSPAALAAWARASHCPVARRSVNAARPYADASVAINWDLVLPGLEKGHAPEVLPRNQKAVDALLLQMVKAMFGARLTVGQAVSEFVPQIDALISASS